MPFPGYHKKEKKEKSGSEETGEPDLSELIRGVLGEEDAGAEDSPEGESGEPGDKKDAITESPDSAGEFIIPTAEPVQPGSIEPAERKEEVLNPIQTTGGDEEKAVNEDIVVTEEEQGTPFQVTPSGDEEETAAIEPAGKEDQEKPVPVEETYTEPEAGPGSGEPIEITIRSADEDTITGTSISSGAGDKGSADIGRPGRKKKVVVEEKKKGFLFLKKKVESIRIYDFATDGSLVEPVLPDGYTIVEDYWIHEGRSRVVIARNPSTNLEEYLLYEPKLSRFELELAERLYEDMRDVLILTDEEILEDKKKVLMEKMSRLLHEYNVKVEDDTLFKLQYYLFRNFLGWSRLDSLMIDPNIEDISCDGSEIPIFLYHRKYRNIRTNVIFDEDTLYSLAILLAQRSGKHISVSQPMLDATLPDGSRLQLTLGKEVTSRGTSFTIRKFREEPFSPIELIDYGTFNVDQLVYFWLAIENNKSLLFVGGTASGKTTSLNAVSLFIPPLSKIVSIEDTREITLYHENWIATVTRESVTESSGSKIDMFDLLKAAMRQRPEYILVGEVRGVEAQTLFQAMNTGHTTFSTLHANSVDAAIHRLENAPLNVPRNMVQALDIVTVQALVFRGKERVRRALEVVEIAGIDPGTGNLRVNTVFDYDPVSDIHSYSGRSQVYTKIMEVRGWSKEEMSEEIVRRQKIIQAMHDQGIIDYINVTKVFQAYAINSANVLENLSDLKKAFL
ncbi:MAG: Flp pilus assembly complex ATPase component TadA [Methanomicrobiaceae archaeon]|nr:Flp pilus assembly complex ATPase component TadA [Methanomicrobiaceae archaeon]